MRALWDINSRSILETITEAFPKTGDYTMDSPFRWAGGKRRLLPVLLKHFPEFSGRYFEPFFGGGATFFSILPPRSFLSDVNSELISTLSAIRDCPESVHSLYSRHRTKHSLDYYRSVRTMTPRTIHGIAARFMYLNRACFNGIYRVNAKNEFNVPMGNREPRKLSYEMFKEWSFALRTTKLSAEDFEVAINKARAGDLIYADPPYVTRKSDGAFIRYNENIFNWDDQVRLYQTVRKAQERGAHIVMTNANHDSIRDLYEKEFKIKIVTRDSFIAASSVCRGSVTELVIYG